MNETPKTLPEDAESWPDFVGNLMREKDAQIALRDEAIAHLTLRVERLQEQLNLAIARRYSARSEKGPSPQMGLFDEAEVEAEREALAAEEPPVVESVVAGHVRKARGYGSPCQRRSRGSISSMNCPKTSAGAPMDSRWW